MDRSTTPAWSVLRTVDDAVEGPDDVAWIDEPVRVPSSAAPGITAAEDTLALALLELRVSDRMHLTSLVGASTR